MFWYLHDTCNIMMYCSNLKHCTLITHWGRTVIGSDNGLSTGRRHAIIWSNAGILLIVPLETNFYEFFIEIHTFSFKEIHWKIVVWKMASILFRPQCVNERWSLWLYPISLLLSLYIFIIFFLIAPCNQKHGYILGVHLTAFTAAIQFGNHWLGAQSTPSKWNCPLGWRILGILECTVRDWNLIYFTSWFEFRKIHKGRVGIVMFYMCTSNNVMQKPFLICTNIIPLMKFTLNVQYQIYTISADKYTNFKFLPANIRNCRYGF